jgi:hypothetical protein
MNRIEKDEDRENRIFDEAVVDAYGPEEQAIGWYYYLDDRLSFPFTARCIRERSISPLQEGEEAEALDMASADDCEREMFILIRWMNRTLAVPLSQIEAIGVDEEAQEAIADWHYWVARGYEFG